MNNKWSTFALTNKHIERDVILTIFQIQYCKWRHVWKHRTVRIGTEIINIYGVCMFLLVLLVQMTSWLKTLNVMKEKQKMNIKWPTFILTDRPIERGLILTTLQFIVNNVIFEKIERYVRHQVNQMNCEWMHCDWMRQNVNQRTFRLKLKNEKWLK